MIEFGIYFIFFIYSINYRSIFRVGFPEMPDLNIKVTPTYGANQYSYTLLEDFLSAKVRAELKVRNRVLSI